MDTCLANVIRRHAAATPHAPCLVFENQTLSYADMQARSSRVANALKDHGVAAGDRVAIVARNAPAFFELVFGCAKAGAVLTPINWRLSAREIGGILDDAKPVLVMAGAEQRASLPGDAAPIVELETAYPTWRDSASHRDPGRASAPDDVVLLLYTSGTTGAPKGAMITHRNMSYTARLARDIWSFTRESVNLVAMPLFHIGGLGYGMTAMTQGGNTVLLQQAAPEPVLLSIAQHGVTHAFFVPAVIHTLVEAAGNRSLPMSSLRWMIYGASPIDESLLRRAMAVFGCGFSHAYGMTETAGTVVTLAPEDHVTGEHPTRLRSCGLPAPWVELGLFDPATEAPTPVGIVGEIRIRSGMVMKGYWNKPVETAEAITRDGWLRTGDAAFRDGDGYVYIRDRYKDMIVSGGENVYPAEVENVLYEHPGVAEVAVIGARHERWGETPKAIVVLRPGEQVSSPDLIAFARQRLAHYKCPTRIEFVAALPRSAAGKVLKRELRALEAAKREAPE